MARKPKEKEPKYPVGAPSQYPNTMLVGDSCWAIKLVRDIEGKSAYGAADPTCKTIYIEMAQTRKEMMSTMIHELLHAIEIEYGLTIRHKMVNNLEVALTNLLVDNAVAWHRILYGDG